MASHKRRPPLVLPEMAQAGVWAYEKSRAASDTEADLCRKIYVAMLHARLDARRGVSREKVAAALRDKSRTMREISDELGVSYSIARAVADEFGISRYRGGDRRSPEARARYRSV